MFISQPYRWLFELRSSRKSSFKQGFLGCLQYLKGRTEVVIIRKDRFGRIELIEFEGTVG